MNTDHFDKCFVELLKEEGGFCNYKEDPGGATNYGISLRFLKDIELDIDGDGIIDKDDILALKPEKAKEIYKKHFWLKNKCDQIQNFDIARKFFDMSVNMGLSQATKIAQRACNDFKLFNLTVDGRIGKNTLQALNQINSEQLLKVIRQECADFYTNLVQAKPQYKKFLNGWLSRAKR